MSDIRPAGFVDYALLFGLAALWGSSFIFIKISVDSIPPLTQTTYRLFVGMCFTWLIFAFYREALPRSPRIWCLIALSALVGVALPFFLISWGQTVVAPGLTAIFMAIMPLGTLLMAHFFTKDEKFSKWKLIGVGFGIFGIVLLVGPALLGQLGGDLLHQGAILLGALCYALNAVVTKYLLEVPKLVLVMFLMTFAFIMVLPVAFIQEGSFHFDYDLLPMGAVFVLAVFHTVIAGFVLVLIVERQGANFFSQINLLVPQFGVLWAFLIFSERPSINAGIALIFILAGVIVARGKVKNK